MRSYPAGYAHSDVYDEHNWHDWPEEWQHHSETSYYEHPMMGEHDISHYLEMQQKQGQA